MRTPVDLKRITTILFDFDGTLADTSEAIVRSMMTTLDEFGIGGYERSYLLATIGRPLLDVAGELCPGRGEEFRRRYREIHTEDHLAAARPYPGVSAALERLRAAGYGLGIVTSKSRMMLELGIEQFGFKGYFDVSVSAEDVAKHKPEPEPVLKALELAGVPGDLAMMVGDTVADVVAGKRAGTWTAAALWGVGKRDDLLAAGPDLALDNIGDLVSRVCFDRGSAVVRERPR
ncbi:MAG: HAD-IA family hydrolase [Ignavibacteriales bacterium]